MQCLSFQRVTRKQPEEGSRTRENGHWAQEKIGQLTNGQIPHVADVPRGFLLYALLHTGAAGG